MIVLCFQECQSSKRSAFLDKLKTFMNGQGLKLVTEHTMHEIVLIIFMEDV